MSVYQKTVTHAPATLNKANQVDDDDDFETDPDYVNDISEKDTRWGSKIIGTDKGNGKDMEEIRSNAFNKHQTITQEEYENKKMLYGGDRAAQNKKD
ncbi:hypothetical protein DDB_G0288379 [Dictyostelium discoideum AX4]|uniref:Uncharacterized protein n=1 Tax=Dictyostelium discoideum TaxID=44689 RepID=Q54J13_DICDI|nr:hypothetical protein DDB_G0288379 [Dictyostelium discoideum AX4]EAL63215.1 hypothetical protein DDB_G0288379 [Dictyostelium discoideum AX4]|eukprot:XP_636717.1 hypothetical protein DDB_G0288379 [Dictyostelium discoideum AX4]